MQSVQVQSLVREVRSHMPRGQKIKMLNRRDIVTDSIRLQKWPPAKEKERKDTNSHLPYISQVTDSKDTQTERVMGGLRAQEGLKESRMWHPEGKGRVFQLRGLDVCLKRQKSEALGCK